MKVVTLLLMLQHARVGLAELSLIKAVAEAFACLGDFLFYLLLILADLVFDEHISTIALL